MGTKPVLYTGAAVLAILMVAASGFYLGNRIARLPVASNTVTSEAILVEAKAKVAPPTIPPKPTQKEITTTVPHQVSVPVTTTTCNRLALPFPGASVCVPVAKTEIHVETVQETVTKLVNATPAENAAWEAQAKAAQADYQQRLNAKIEEIAKDQRNKGIKDALEAGETLIKDTIIPLITALTGLISAIVLLYRGYAPAKPSAGP